MLLPTSEVSRCPLVCRSVASTSYRLCFSPLLCFSPPLGFSPLLQSPLLGRSTVGFFSLPEVMFASVSQGNVHRSSEQAMGILFLWPTFSTLYILTEINFVPSSWTHSVINLCQNKPCVLGIVLGWSWAKAWPFNLRGREGHTSAFIQHVAVS